MDSASLFSGDVLDAYARWSTPTTIISDGAYGVGGFPGDPRTVNALPEWYRPHIEAWSAAADPATTLWFWGTELSWATVHPELDKNGWEYVQTIVWDKGVGHLAGKINSNTIRSFPVVTEVCAFYHRRFNQGKLTAQEWLRTEWARSGLPLKLSNEACGVTNAASRKYLTKDSMWYFPPGDMIERMAAYCDANGNPENRPYFAMGETDKKRMKSVTADEWDALRYRWTHLHGVTNVWSRPPLRGKERFTNGSKSVHLNQKPIEFMERIISAVTELGDTVWEPFGGLCTASVAASRMGRKALCAEANPYYALLAKKRIAQDSS